MKKPNIIKKSLLCAENIQNASYYEDFAMQILNRKVKETTNALALTSDTKYGNLVPTVALNVGYCLATHNSKVLIINMDNKNSAINDLLLKENDDENIFSYGNVDVLLVKSIEIFCGMTVEDLENKFSEYDFVILSVPSPKNMPNYLAVPKNISFYMLISKFFSSYFAVNRCISLIEGIESTVIGSVYIKLGR